VSRGISSRSRQYRRLSQRGSGLSLVGHVPTPASWATACPVAHAIATTSGSFATRPPEMMALRTWLEFVFSRVRGVSVDGYVA
jgi:hypothetical protein